MDARRFVIIFLMLFSNVLCFGQTTGFHTDLKANCKICHVGETEPNDINLAWQKTQIKNYYSPYSSQTLDATVSQPLGSSKLCLSCHDGAMAGDNNGSYMLQSNQVISSDLGTSHPISFRYDSYLAMKDGELRDPNISLSGLGGTIHDDMLINGNLECVSCHDMHGMRGTVNYLIKPNSRSKLCLTCHNK